MCSCRILPNTSDKQDSIIIVWSFPLWRISAFWRRGAISANLRSPGKTSFFKTIVGKEGSS